MNNTSDLMVAQLTLAGEIIKLKYSEGINASLYFLGTQNNEVGLIKIPELFYRGDSVVTSRAPRTFYSLQGGDAVILDCARTKLPVFKDVTSNPINTGLSWVYAYPILNFKSELIAVICLSGSVREITEEFQRDLYVVGVHLARNLDLIFKEGNIPEVWKETILKI